MATAVLIRQISARRKSPSKTPGESPARTFTARPSRKPIGTTSNHRPYTYPDDRVDVPSGTDREGAVKYTDYALKQCIFLARERPWFAHTIFIVVADHCAKSAGKADLTVTKYHIPCSSIPPPGDPGGKQQAVKPD